MFRYSFFQHCSFSQFCFIYFGSGNNVTIEQGKKRTYKMCNYDQILKKNFQNLVEPEPRNHYLNSVKPVTDIHLSTTGNFCPLLLRLRQKLREMK